MTNRQWTPHRYEEDDETGLLKLLALEYSGSDVAELRFFRWQYEQNPAGRALIWAAKDRESGEVVGQLGSGDEVSFGVADIHMTIGVTMDYLLLAVTVRVNHFNAPDVSPLAMPQLPSHSIQQLNASPPSVAYREFRNAISVNVTGAHLVLEVSVNDTRPA